jgi:hypothetical protein
MNSECSTLAPWKMSTFRFLMQDFLSDLKLLICSESIRQPCHLFDFATLAGAGSQQATVLQLSIWWYKASLGETPCSPLPSTLILDPKNCLHLRAGSHEPP